MIAGSCARGAKTIAVDVDDEKPELAGGIGAAHTINNRRDSSHKQLLDLTDGHGPDVIIEAAGSPATFRVTVEEAAFTGKVVYIGYAKEAVSYETAPSCRKSWMFWDREMYSRTTFVRSFNLVEASKFPVDRAVIFIVPFEEAPVALKSWSDKPSRFKKIMVSVA